MLTGDVPSPANPPSGLPVPYPLLEGTGNLQYRRPLLIERPDGESAHLSACHFAELRVIL